ncbi:SWIB/MDM2 domain-containing protein [Gynurincola endophyticus]|uniref:SWIB/MDM2 domain-containing protein n=1 Tax=Gynurincola endophyticus TaxID=2479004 RepID=UPI000F8D9F81|nr:SWIB/MDM2 domain-containing protein [Gynurincola endophyticus]
MAKAAKKAAPKKAAKKAAPKKAAPKKAAKKAAPKKAAKKAAAPKKAVKKAAPKKAAKKAAAPKKAVKKAAPKKAAKPAKKKSARKPNAAFMAPLTPSAELAEVIGSKALPRTEIVKKIWDYIKKNGLQDKKNKRMINADAKLKGIFGKDQISMFDLAKIVSKHVS